MDIKRIIADLQRQYDNLASVLHIKAKQEKLAVNRTSMERADFWNNQERAVAISQETERLNLELTPFLETAGELESVVELVILAEQETDSALAGDIENKLEEIKQRLDDLEFYSLLAGPYDDGPAILSVHARDGGVDAQDFTQMLERMYLRFAERMGFTVEILERTLGNEAGLKSMMMRIVGPYVYGYLQGENGVHRLLRNSPFNADALRQTSFALVEVIPELPDSAEVPIKDEDLRIDLYHSSGPGGQNVNKTESAIRLTHLPSGLVVACQTERSQHQNREIAFRILRSKLYLLEQEKREVAVKNLRGEVRQVAWGQQIRSYTLYGRQLVKDHRTNFESTNVEAVLDGDIKSFAESYLRFKKHRAGI